MQVWKLKFKKKIKKSKADANVNNLDSSFKNV